MGNINKPIADAKRGKTVEELKADYAKAKGEIRKLLADKKDRNELKPDEVNALKIAYITASHIAKNLSERVLDDAQEDYARDYKKLADAAAKYGSVVKSTIPDTTLDDVKGLHEVKRIIKNFIYIAQNDEIIKQYNLQGGLGMLMYGPPGTGKTMIAEAIANAMRLPLFIITPADIFKSYVGESEQAVRAIFQELDLCDDGAILFVDECESIFSKRTSDTKDYKAAVTTELLQRMNGFGVNGSKRIMIAATNRPDIIDPAYLRFKRFSYQVFVDLPDPEAKAAIIAKKIPPVGLANDITQEDILHMACRPGCNYSAADLCGIIEKACMYAIGELQNRPMTLDTQTEVQIVGRKAAAAPVETPELPAAIPLSRDMFIRAFKDTPARLTDAELASYKNFSPQ